jgi:hypothetical protein
MYLKTAKMKVGFLFKLFAKNYLIKIFAKTSVKATGKTDL